MKTATSILSHIGNTPFIRLHLSDNSRSAHLYCKLEYLNPSGSIKDRLVSAIIENLESQKVVAPGDTFVEASGGNTAISLSAIAAAKGYKVALAMPETVSEGRKRLLASYGARLFLTPAAFGMKGSIEKSHQLLESISGSHLLNQFETPINPLAHERYTAEEIIGNLGMVPDIFIAGVGTGGTITGVGKRFKDLNPECKIVAVEPFDSPILSGGNPGKHTISGIGPGFVPPILNLDLLDDVVAVRHEEAVAACRLVAKRTGIFAGLSSGACIHAALQKSEMFSSDTKIVTLINDAGERYLYD